MEVPKAYEKLVKKADCDSNFILLRIIKTYRIIKIKIRS